MKIEIETDDIEIFEKYSRADGHREWGRITWLYSGDITAGISGESAKRIMDVMREKGAEPSPAPKL